MRCHLLLIDADCGARDFELFPSIAVGEVVPSGSIAAVIRISSCDLKAVTIDADTIVVRK